MPGKHIEGVGNGSMPPCKRCQVAEATVLVRMEHLCTDCFMTYVRTKVVKRMESYRVRHSTKDKQRILLLPLSLGTSSVSLLHILDYQIQSQIDRTQRAGYELQVLMIEDPDFPDSTTSKAMIAAIERRYPRYIYTKLPLADIFEYAQTNEEGTQEEESALLGAISRKVMSKEENLDALLSSLPSATSRADVISTLRTKLIVEFGKRRGCEGIFWGDSTTRLAEKTLAETAKGRGFSLPWQVSDGESPHGINFKYPLRDLLRKELGTFSDLTSPPLTDLILAQPHSAQISASAKSTTIDNLMSQYFETVEENFPSIVANVVRTSSKLTTLRRDGHELICELCSMPIEHASSGLHNWGGYQQEVAVEMQYDSSNSKMCYGCTRSLLGSAIVGV
ncbi:MAG: hypothetical protein M1812_004095 [Candelaria pacifica]|nr:MAG: hypothetical protein M1812_004095 [Candelaria pacifica]